MIGLGTGANADVDGKRDVVVNSLGMRLQRIEPGEFQMGTPQAEGVRADETPQHRVRITRPYYLGVYEVTQSEYTKVMGRNDSFFADTGSGKSIVAGLDTRRFPAEEVTWFAATEFCRRLSQRPDEKRAERVYRLPTEAEWEFASRAGHRTAFSTGTSLSAEQANFNGKYPAGGALPGKFLARTTEVGSFSPNASGLYDMHGNVWEWCADWYDREYYKKSPVDDPRGPTAGTSRVIRGGGWYSDGRDCRSTYRNAELPEGVFYVMGFRVAMSTGRDAEQYIASTTSDSQSESAGPARQTGDSRDPVTSSGRRAVGLKSGGEEWPKWRGPRGDGSWHGPRLPLRWPDTGLTRLWRKPIGGGYSGIIAVNGLVITADRPKPDEEPAEEGMGTERIIGFDADSGKQRWVHEYEANYGDLDYGNGPRATPTFHENRIYMMGAIGHFVCLDANSGEVLWKHALVHKDPKKRPMWGLSASPVIFDNLVIAHAGLPPNACLQAFDRKTGEEVWRSLPDGAGYATPLIIESNGAQRLVCWTPTNVRGLDPRTGAVLWTVPFEVTYGTAIACPIFREGILFVSGYWEGSKAIKLGPQGGEPVVTWEDRRNLRGLMSQPLYRDGHVYLLDKSHGLTCFELQTGKKLWDDDNAMTPKGRNPQATLVWLGESDRTIVLNSDGELILARFTPKGYQELSRTKVIGRTWAHPAYAYGRVYARSDSEIVCYSLISENQDGEK